MSKTLRLYGITHQELSDMKQDGESFDDVLQRIIPENTETLERPEDEVVAVRVSDETHQRIMDLAGQNVNVSVAVHEFINEQKDLSGYV